MSKKKRSAKELVKVLRSSSTGENVWRVADKKTHSYCIQFTYHDSARPESECRAWFADKLSAFPDTYKNMAVESCVVFTAHEKLCLEAADAIESLLKTAGGK